MKVADDLLERARQIHRGTIVAAVHTDLIGDVAERHSQGEQAVLARRHADLFRAAGIRCISDHVVGDTFETQSFPSRDLLRAFIGGRPYNPSMLKHALKLITYMLDDLEESQEAFALATSVAQIRDIAGGGRVAVVLCTQGLTPVEDEPVLLELYHRLGIRVLGVATYRGNMAVGGSRENTTIGLTALGREIVDAAMRLRLVLDLSAASPRGFWDILEMSQGPVIASNTNVASLCDHPGNFDDAQLKAIGETGGVVGLIANGRLVTRSERVTLDDFVAHIDYIAEHVGVDHVGIGPDIVEDTWYPLETYRRLFAGEGFWATHYPEGFPDHTALPVVTAELLRRGYPIRDVEKILGGNILRVYKVVWGD